VGLELMLIMLPRTGLGTDRNLYRVQELFEDLLSMAQKPFVLLAGSESDVLLRDSHRQSFLDGYKDQHVVVLERSFKSSSAWPSYR
jgi:hypothetical protein